MRESNLFHCHRSLPFQPAGCSNCTCPSFGHQVCCASKICWCGRWNRTPKCGPRDATRAPTRCCRAPVQSLRSLCQPYETRFQFKCRLRTPIPIGKQFDWNHGPNVENIVLRGRQSEKIGSLPVPRITIN